MSGQQTPGRASQGACPPTQLRQPLRDAMRSRLSRGPVPGACVTSSFSPLFAAPRLLRLSTGLSALPPSVCIFRSLPAPGFTAQCGSPCGEGHPVLGAVTQVIPEAAGWPADRGLASDAWHPSRVSCGPENGLRVNKVQNHLRRKGASSWRHCDRRQPSRLVQSSAPRSPRLQSFSRKLGFPHL